MSHQAYRNYILTVLFWNFVAPWLWIGCMPGIGCCSNPWACTTNWEGHADRDLFFQTLLFAKLLLFRSNPCLSSFPAIIRPHFLLIRLQQYAWNCDKQPLAPNLESKKKYIRAPNPCFSSLIWLPMLASNKFSFSLLCSSFQIGDILLISYTTRLCSKGAISADWLQCWSR